MSFTFNDYTSTFFSDGTALVSAAMPLSYQNSGQSIDDDDDFHILERRSHADKRLLIVRTASEVVVFQYRGVAHRTHESELDDRLTSTSRVCELYEDGSTWYFLFEDGDQLICTAEEYRIIRRRRLHVSSDTALGKRR